MTTVSTGVVRGFLSILGAKFTTLLLGVAITPFLVRFLGSKLYGDYAFALSLLSVTMILVNAGIFDGTRKYIAENRASEGWVEGVLGFYLRVAGLSAVLVAAGYALAALSGLPSQLFGANFGTYFFLLAGLIVTKQAYLVGRGALMGLGLEHRSEPMIVVERFLFGFVGLALAYQGFGVSGVLLGHIIAGLIVAGAIYGLLSQRIDLSRAILDLPDTLPRVELLSFNGLSILLILLTASLYHLDILLLQPLVGSEATGFYRAALVVAEFLWFVPNALQTVLVQSTSRLWSSGDPDKVSQMVSRLSQYNILLTLLLAIGLWVLAEDFVVIYFGAEYQPAVQPLRILLPGAFGFAIARPIFAAGQGKGALRLLILATGTASIVNLALNLLLIPRYGVVGAASATSVGYGSMVLLHVWAAHRIGFAPMSGVPLGRIALCGLVTFLAIIGLTEWIDSLFITFLAVPAVGLSLFGGAAIALDVLSWKEVSLVVGRFKSVGTSA